MSPTPEPLTLTVDGERFVVRARPDQPGTYDIAWLTGPHDYGFTSATYDRSAMSRSALEEAIRDFLDRVDPTTGYLD